MADGAVLGSPGSPSWANYASGATFQKPQQVNVVVVNSEDDLRKEFPGMVENAVVANISKRGKIHQAVRATSK
jgi:hypothetical protein